MKITFSMKKPIWLAIYSTIAVVSLTTGVFNFNVDPIQITASAVLALLIVWSRIRINGKKTYPSWLDKLDKKLGIKPLEE